ncbi:MAG: DNA alkylation repair protein [endosymbiont of Seepiophila jonesi]|uniref:DNA alkylation repair protein n=1 Tax=endosymbiont of Lamellibrachia luymesi TaxID=2200907 RepID=A0A370DNQ8_9GAMM|nr:MAG: DNA alkylation repair protein [endosymbiont of Lamellibrachia luymesi]RDH93884.1 MAG: DNA alkylation repair protein [endosymbiont of Seepiophila jonesi]
MPHQKELSALRAALKSRITPGKAETLQRFFKTGPGEYGEGDRFHGVVVPDQRKIARQFKTLALPAVEQLLQSAFHEERLTALFILIHQFEMGNLAVKKRIFQTYVRNMKYINNWDLVDSSAPHIIGTWLEQRDRSQLYEWAYSDDLWQRRIAMLATFRYIKNGKFEDALNIAGKLLDDSHDLIHKAVGWMLREIGKRDLPREIQFLDRHAATMPRTMLRYAIEKLPESQRQTYLKLKL